jgi:hypothetical protein
MLGLFERPAWVILLTVGAAEKGGGRSLALPGRARDDCYNPYHMQNAAPLVGDVRGQPSLWKCAKSTGIADNSVIVEADERCQSPNAL